MKNKISFSFAITGSLLIISFFIFINWITSSWFPWSIFPIFAVLWWPLSVYCYHKKSPLLMAISGTMLIIIFFIIVNRITSPWFSWSIFPIFAVLWWPLSVYCYLNKNPLLMSILGAVLTAIFFVTANWITSPWFPWSIFPVFAVLWWPLSVYCATKKKSTLFSFIGTALITIFLFLTDFVTSRQIEWAHYVFYPLLFWPVGMILKKYYRDIRLHILVGILITAYYGFINIIISPGYPWSLFILLEIILILYTRYFWNKREELWFWTTGLIIFNGLLWGILLLTGIKDLWVYQMAVSLMTGQFAIILCHKRKYKSLVIVGGLLLLFFLIMNNLIHSSAYYWFYYPLFPVIWFWIMMIFFKKIKSVWFAWLSAVTGILYYLILNIFLSPGYPWFIYPSFALVWWPLSVNYYKTKKHLRFALFGSALIITLMVLINLTTFPAVPWCFFPIFAVLWWPLSVYFFYYRLR